MFKIGNIEIKNKIVMAPMAGISNPAFIKIVAEMGLGLAYTELISAEAIVRNNKKTFDMLNGIETLKIPVGIQLFGSNTKTLAQAAKIVTDIYKNIFIDINMGCPVPKVALKNQAGSALLKNPLKIKEIVEAVVEAVSVPVTVKIRSGWDFNSINAKEVAKICESAGAKAIAIHARTRSQGYGGKADWSIIKEVKENVSIPVIGNGDIITCYDAKKMIEETGCDAVMIGRALIGNPWLIKECVQYLEQKLEPTEIKIEEKITIIKQHYQYLKEIKPEKVALLEIRNLGLHYLKGFPNSKKWKNEIIKIKTEEELYNILKEIKEEECENNL